MNRDDFEFISVIYSNDNQYKPESAITWAVVFIAIILLAIIFLPAIYGFFIAPHQVLALAWSN
jgi:hypothetical protein